MTEEDKEQLEQLEKRITTLESTVSSMDTNLRKEEESLIFMERMSECLQLQNKKITNIIQNLPEQLPEIPDRYKLPSNALSTIIQTMQQQNIGTDSFFDGSTQTVSPQINHNHNNNNNQRRIAKTKRKAVSINNDNPRATKRRKMNDHQYILKNNI